MTLLILGSVILGIIIGKLGLLPLLDASSDLISAIALNILVFTVGLDMGHNREVWQKISRFGWKIIFLPLGIALGSLLGAFCVNFFLNLPTNHALAVGAGFGWYSLSGVMLKEMVSIELGTVAFLANVFRELLAVIFIPILALKLGGLAAIAPCGATSMDTTLPLISRSAGAEMALLGFISGAVLSMLVPMLVPLLVNL